VHLAYRNAAPGQRLYLHCHLELPTTSTADPARISPGSACTTQTTSATTSGPGSKCASTQLGPFLQRLGRRDIHLRPGIAVRRLWPWAHAVDLDERGALAGEVRQAVTVLLTALDEPLPSLYSCPHDRDLNSPSRETRPLTRLSHQYLPPSQSAVT